MPDNDPKVLAATIPRSTDWPWYHKEIGKSLTSDARALLENYGHIAPEQVEEHIYKIVSIHCYQHRFKAIRGLEKRAYSVPPLVLVAVNAFP